MGSLSKEHVMAAIKANQAPPPPPPRNALQRVRDLFSSAEKSDTSVAAYRKYALEAQTRGEEPMSQDEWRRQRQPRNALAK